MVISVALLCQFVAVAASAVAQNKLQFLLLRSVMGITAGLTFPTAMVFSTEIVQNSHRESERSDLWLYSWSWHPASFLPLQQRSFSLTRLAGDGLFS